MVDTWYPAMFMAPRHGIDGTDPNEQPTEQIYIPSEYFVVPSEIQELEEADSHTVDMMSADYLALMAKPQTKDYKGKRRSLSRWDRVKYRLWLVALCFGAGIVIAAIIASAYEGIKNLLAA